MIAVIDYNCGNPRSVINMINRIGEEAILTRDKKKIFEATKVIIPGVGSFDHGMSSLKKFDLHDMLKEIANNGKPILGICLGMQLLGLSSEEGEQEGLGLIDATFHKFNNYNIEIKVPHVGWNDVQIAQNSILFKQKKGIESRFYFVHSYYVECSKDLIYTYSYFDDFKFLIPSSLILLHRNLETEILT